MRISYDREADAAYLELSSKKADGGTELAEGVILHTTETNEIVGIEILEASSRFPVKTLYQYEFVRSDAA